VKEIQSTMRWTQEKYLISRKYFEIYQMVGNISIDGFKRERYVVKVKDISDELALAYAQLNEAEAKIESAFNQKKDTPAKEYSVGGESYSTERNFGPAENYNDYVQAITHLLLMIEQKEVTKIGLLAKLKNKEKKWIENDKIFKERRFTLMSVLQYDLALVIDCGKHLLYLESVSQRRIA
jgi:predicted S18 family serine protease